MRLRILQPLNEGQLSFNETTSWSKNLSQEMKIYMRFFSNYILISFYKMCLKSQLAKKTLLIYLYLGLFFYILTFVCRVHVFAKSIKNQMNQVSHNNIILVNNTGKLVRKKRITGKITNILFIKRERSETVTRVSITVSHLLDGRNHQL